MDYDGSGNMLIMLLRRVDVDGVLTALAFILGGVFSFVLAFGEVLDAANAQLAAILAIAASLGVLWRTVVSPIYRAMRSLVDTVEAISELPDHVATLSDRLEGVEERQTAHDTLNHLAALEEHTRRTSRPA